MRGWMGCCLGLFLASSLWAAEPKITLPNCLLALDEEVQVPAQAAGVLLKIPVREGQQVTVGELLAQIDDNVRLAQQQVAEYKLKAAKKQAEDDTAIRYAQAAALVAEAEYEQAMDANKRVAGVVPQADVRRLLLTHRQMVLSIEKSEKEREIAGYQAQVSEAELRAADAELKNYRLVSPLDGEVIELSRHEGEWVQAGDPIMRLLRLDRLRVEGFLNAKEYSPAELENRPVRVVVTLARGRQEMFPGKIVFVKPLIQAGNQFLVRAEVQNRRQNNAWVLRPGMNVDMTIELQ
ncbi:MAG: HlyD family efflux transporter periplasmic adaptor subunit [Thermoguttaceae bacterium]